MSEKLQATVPAHLGWYVARFDPAPPPASRFRGEERTGNARCEHSVDEPRADLSRVGFAERNLWNICAMRTGITPA